MSVIFCTMNCYRRNVYLLEMLKKIVKFACPNRFIVAFNIKFAPQVNKKFAKGV